MTENHQLQSQQTRMARLREKRQAILSLPPEKALNAILDSEEALPLVHSFAEEDLYFLVHEIGLGDAVPILALASAKQWEYMLDLEVWEKDRITGPAVLNWMELLMQADPARLTTWLRDEKTDLLEFCLYKHVAVMVREHDQDPSEFGDDCVTFDDVYYFRIKDEPKENESQEPADGRRWEILSHLLGKLAENDHIKYHRILVESTSLLSAEAEEEMYRLRNIRLSEKGFLPFEEALGIYQPLGSEECEDFKSKRVFKNPGKFIPLCLSPSVLLAGDDLFSRAVRIIDREAVADQIRIEFAALCNRIVAADQAFVREREALRKIVKKASGYLSIGLQRLMEEGTGKDVEQAAALLQGQSLSDIFRIGYDRVMKLKRKAEKWKAASWFLRAGLPLSFWGELRVGVIGGLLLKRPLYYDNFETGVLYREFAAPADIQRCESLLQEIMAYDRLLSLVQPTFPAKLAQRSPTYACLLLTNWVWAHLRLPETEPIPLGRFKDFCRELFSDSVMEAGAGETAKIAGHKIRPAMKQAFLLWLMQASGLTEDEILADLSGAFEKLFHDIENEYGAVAIDDLEPRFIHLFMVE